MKYLAYLAFLSILLTSSLSLNLYRTTSSVGQPLGDIDNKDINMQYTQTDTPKTNIISEGFIEERYIKDFNNIGDYNTYILNDKNNLLDNPILYKDKHKDLKIRKRRNTYKSQICDPEFKVCNNLQFLNMVSCDLANRLATTNFTAFNNDFNSTNKCISNLYNIYDNLENEFECKTWNKCGNIKSAIFDLSSIVYNTQNLIKKSYNEMLNDKLEFYKVAATYYISKSMEFDDSCILQTSKEPPRFRQEKKLIPGFSCELKSKDEDCQICEKINVIADNCKKIAKSLINDFKLLYPSETEKQKMVETMQTYAKGLETDKNILYNELKTFQECSLLSKCIEIVNVVYELSKAKKSAGNIISYMDSFDSDTTSYNGGDASYDVSNTANEILQLIFESKDDCTRRISAENVDISSSLCYEGGSKTEYQKNNAKEKYQQELGCRTESNKKDNVIKDFIKEIVLSEISAIPLCICFSTDAQETESLTSMPITNPTTPYSSTIPFTQEEMSETTETEPAKTITNSEITSQVPLNEATIMKKKTIKDVIRETIMKDFVSEPVYIYRSSNAQETESSASMLETNPIILDPKTIHLTQEEISEITETVTAKTISKTENTSEAPLKEATEMKDEVIIDLFKDIISKSNGAKSVCICRSTNAQEGMSETMDNKPTNTIADAEKLSQDQLNSSTSITDDGIASNEDANVNNNKLNEKFDKSKTKEQGLTDENLHSNGYRHFGSKMILTAASLLVFFGYFFNANIF